MSDRQDLLERDEEITAFAATVGLAASRSASVAAVLGAAGLGKSVLLAEAVRLASAAGFDVLSARGSELEQDFAFGVVRQLFEPTLVRMDAAERDAVLAGSASNASAAVLSSAAPGDTPGDFAIWHGLYWLTANLSERRAVALMIDDLHWADTASLRFLTYLLPRLEGLPVAVFVALRPDGLMQGGQLLNRLVTAPETGVIRLAPLSEQASGKLVRRVLDTEHAESGFLTACFQATHGNPLLLRDLAGTFKAEGLGPTSGNVRMVDVVGPRAVAQRVALWMARLPKDCLGLARAVAVLGDGCALAHAAELAELPVEDAARAARDLERADLFLSHNGADHNGMAQRVQFSHPLVRTTVYEEINPAERVSAHHRAASLVQRWRGGLEQVASHLLRVPPAHDQRVVDLLLRAAEDVFAHGSPDTAATYLRRCLIEPPAEELLVHVQRELGKVMTLIDTNGAAQDLQAALDSATDPISRGKIAVLLGTALFYLLRFDDAERVCLDALAELPRSETDLRASLEAILLQIPLLEPRRSDLADRRHACSVTTGQETFGSMALDCILAAHAAWRSEPDSVALALRGLRSGVDQQVYPATLAVPAAWLVLIVADRDEVLESIGDAIARAHHNGSVQGLTTAFILRGLAWLWRGQLTEAEADIRSGMRHADTSRLELGHLLAHTLLADVLMERGELSEAEATLDALHVPDPLPTRGPLFWYMDTRTRLLRHQGRFAEALEMALTTGRRIESHEGNNPGFLLWRSEAALCAHTLGRDVQARALAEEDLRVATRWRAPRALGRALRVSGVVHGGAAGIGLLQQAVDVLEPSPAQLEYAAALLELGILLRGSGSRTKARHFLGKALDIADSCAAKPLCERAKGELRRAGVRPKRSASSGAPALTPSERRVAELAAGGHTNKQIAQQLFVTVKTIEVHLTNAYRKVSVTNRADLAGALSQVRVAPAGSTRAGR